MDEFQAFLRTLEEMFERIALNIHAILLERHHQRSMGYTPYEDRARDAQLLGHLSSTLHHKKQMASFATAKSKTGLSKRKRQAPDADGVPFFNYFDEDALHSTPSSKRRRTKVPEPTTAEPRPKRKYTKRKRPDVVEEEEETNSTLPPPLPPKRSKSVENAEEYLTAFLAKTQEMPTFANAPAVQPIVEEEESVQPIVDGNNANVSADSITLE